MSICVLPGRTTSEEQEVRSPEAAVQTAQACCRGLFPHGSTLQFTKVSIYSYETLNFNIQLFPLK